MAYPSGTFKAAFWETDFLSQHGFDTLVTHIKEGQKSCKWLEDCLKARAKAEDDYAKALTKISKSTVNEFGSLRNTVEELRTESENEATFHMAVAQKIQEEVAKLTEFREKQKEERKKQEDTIHRINKNKADLYRRMLSCKNTYENRFKAAEKAESDAEKLKFGTKQKETEKARKQATQARANSSKADEDYKNSVAALEGSRLIWVREHASACDEFQRMEEERIMFMRNTIWIFSNLVSDLCCRLDDSREKIRLSAEQCSEQKDIEDFVDQKSTCVNPLMQIEYVPCGGSSPATPPLSSGHNDQSHTPLPSVTVNGSSFYEMSEEPGTTYTALYDYIPAASEEIELKQGDKLKVSPAEQQMDDGWLTGVNLRTNITGLFPRNYVE